MIKITKHKIAYAVLLSAFCLLFSSCDTYFLDVNSSYTTASEQESHDENTTTFTHEIEETLDNMTLKEKICQLFIVKAEALQPSHSSAVGEDTNDYWATSFDEEMSATLREYPVGGIILFGKNIIDPTQLNSFVSSMQNQSKTIRLFLATDEEGGRVSRIASNPAFDVPQFTSMQDIGLTGDTDNAFSACLAIGTYMKQYGFNLDFAPDADVNTNPENIVIGDRSFGSDPYLVSDMVSSAIYGFHCAGAMCCVKHFPGHGDTKGDTHEGFVSIAKTWDQLRECELIPFIGAIEASTDMIMISHITAPNITQDSLPSSMSYAMVSEKLRGELGFDGVIITDSMSMKAVTLKYTSAESAVKSIQAGVDIVLMPQNFSEAYDAVYSAVTDERISLERIDESVLRILTLKKKYGLL